jgi:hypothetical protein
MDTGKKETRKGKGNETNFEYGVFVLRLASCLELAGQRARHGGGVASHRLTCFVFSDTNRKKLEREKLLTTYEEIKAELLSEWEHLTESRLHEYAESNTPVYYSEIAKEWHELPMEHSDRWQEFGIEFTPDTTIFSLMTTDLHLYYMELVQKAFEDITEEKQEEENERE